MRGLIIKKTEQWNNRNESYIYSLIFLCKDRVKQHNAAGYFFKRRNNRCGLPSILIPTIMAPISVLLEPHPLIGKYINAVAFIITGVTVGVSSFFKYAEKMANHFNIALKYADIASDIELELMKGREFRIHVDTFAVKIHMLLDSLTNNSPTLPQCISFADEYSGDYDDAYCDDDDIRKSSFHFTPVEV